ncbi:MAG: hypothetical protein ABI681_04085 [Gemmatimonadales bacterium]
MLEASRRQPWVRAAFLVGVVYFVVGRAFAAPTNHVHAWRLAAWVVSGAAFAAHIAYEHFRLRNSPRSAALHAALAVALGAFLLAIAGALHSLLTTSTIRPSWLLALVVWPVATAVPAFVAALGTAAGLSRYRRNDDVG